MKRRTLIEAQALAEAILCESVSSGKIRRLFAQFEEAPTTEGIEAAEENWRGGLADFGDRESAYLIQNMPGYFEYRGHLQDAARNILGNSFPVYRLMSRDQFEEWQSGADIGPIAVSFDPHWSEAFRKFAGFKPEQAEAAMLVEITANPESIVMRGKTEEAEVVLDANMINASDVRLIGDPSGTL